MTIPEISPQPEQELSTEQVRELLEGIAPGEWQRDGTTVFALNEAGTNRFFATFQSPDAPPLMMIRSAELSAHSAVLARDLITEREAHAATRAQLAARDAALAEAEAVVKWLEAEADKDVEGYDPTDLTTLFHLQAAGNKRHIAEVLAQALAKAQAQAQGSGQGGE